MASDIFSAHMMVGMLVLALGTHGKMEASQTLSSMYGFSPSNGPSPETAPSPDQPVETIAAALAKSGSRA